MTKKILAQLLLISALFLGVASVPIMGQDSAESVSASPLKKLTAKAREKKRRYSESFRAKAELKKRQKSEIEELKKEHRLARESFPFKEKTSDERKEFFRTQRDEMAELKRRHKREKNARRTELKDKNTSNH